MGNQQGTNPYQHFQTQPNTSAIQSFPYGSTPSTWGYPLPSTPSTINNYYQQGYPPPKWPSVTNLPPPAQPQNFQGSYVSDNGIRGSQLQLQAQQAQVQAQMQAQLQAQMENQIRGSQLSGGYYGSQYGGGGYVDQGNTKMRGGSGGGNQQRVSGLGQQQGQSPSQLSYQQPSQIQQQQYQQQQIINSQLTNKHPSNIPRNQPQLSTLNNLSVIPQHSQIHPTESHLSPTTPSFPHSQLHQPTTILTSPPSILQNKNQPFQSSILRNNRSSSKQKKISFGDQVPKSLQLLKANLKLTKDKFDKLAMDQEMELLSITEEVDSEVNQGLPSKNKLIYLLHLKQLYQQTIIKIRMKQHKLHKIYTQLQSLSPQQTLEINTLIDTYNKQLFLIDSIFPRNWREILAAETAHPQFSKSVQEGQSNPIVMQGYQAYRAKVDAAFGRLPANTHTSSVMTILKTNENPPASYNYEGYTGVGSSGEKLMGAINDSRSVVETVVVGQEEGLQSQIQQQSQILSQNQSQKTARFADVEQFPYSSNLHPTTPPSSTIQQSNLSNTYNLNIISPSQLHTTQVFPQSPPSQILTNSKIVSPSSSLTPQIPLTHPVLPPRIQVPKLADFAHSKVIPPPPQMHPFLPPTLPTTSSFKI